MSSLPPGALAIVSIVVEIRASGTVHDSMRVRKAFEFPVGSAPDFSETVAEGTPVGRCKTGAERGSATPSAVTAHRPKPHILAIFNCPNRMRKLLNFVCREVQQLLR